MDKLTMRTANLADENFKKLAALFPNAVTETVNENGEVVRAIDKDVLMQEINTHVVDGREERYLFTWPDKKKAMLAANAPISATLRPAAGTVRICISRATIWTCSSSCGKRIWAR